LRVNLSAHIFSCAAKGGAILHQGSSRDCQNVTADQFLAMGVSPSYRKVTGWHLAENDFRQVAPERKDNALRLGEHRRISMDLQHLA
jgi:hypothetical protein